MSQRGNTISEIQRNQLLICHKICYQRQYWDSRNIATNNPVFPYLSIMITVNTDKAIRDLKKFFEPLTPQQAKTAVSRSINEALTTGRAQLVREIASVYTIKPMLIRKQLDIIKANSNLLEGKIRGETRRHSLSDFKNSKYDAGSSSMRSIATVRQNGKPIKSLKARKLTAKSSRLKDRKKLTSLMIEIRKGQSMFIRSAFLLQSRGGTVWAGRGRYNSQFNFDWRDKRVTKEGNDLPVNKLLTMSVYAAAINKTVQIASEPKITERYIQRLTHNLTVGLNHRGKYN